MSCKKCTLPTCGFSKSNSATLPSAIVKPPTTNPQTGPPGVNPWILFSPTDNHNFLPKGVRGVLVSHASDVSRACSCPFFCPLRTASGSRPGNCANKWPACLERRPWKRFEKAGIEFIVPLEREEEFLGSHYHYSNTTIDELSFFVLFRTSQFVWKNRRDKSLLTCPQSHQSRSSGQPVHNSRAKKAKNSQCPVNTFPLKDLPRAI